MNFNFVILSNVLVPWWFTGQDKCALTAVSRVRFTGRELPGPLGVAQASVLSMPVQGLDEMVRFCQEGHLV